MRRIVVLSVAITLLPLALMSFLSLRKAQAEDQELGELTGSWTVTATPDTVTLPNGTTFTPAPFTSLVAYDEGGSVTETNTSFHTNSVFLNPLLPFDASEGFGEWGGIDQRHFNAKIEKLLFDIRGQNVGSLEITESVGLVKPPGTLVGRFKANFKDANGNVLNTSTGGLVGRRIKFQLNPNL